MRARKLPAVGWATVCSCSSQSKRCRLRSATLPSRHVDVERKHFSISLLGRARVRTHSRKFAQ